MLCHFTRQCRHFFVKIIVIFCFDEWNMYKKRTNRDFAEKLLITFNMQRNTKGYQESYCLLHLIYSHFQWIFKQRRDAYDKNDKNKLYKICIKKISNHDYIFYLWLIYLSIYNIGQNYELTKFIYLLQLFYSIITKNINSQILIM